MQRSNTNQTEGVRRKLETGTERLQGRWRKRAQIRRTRCTLSSEGSRVDRAHGQGHPPWWRPREGRRRAGELADVSWCLGALIPRTRSIIRASSSGERLQRRRQPQRRSSTRVFREAGDPETCSQRRRAKIRQGNETRVSERGREMQGKKVICERSRK